MKNFFDIRIFDATIIYRKGIILMSNTNVTTTTLESGNYAAKYSERGFFDKVGSAIKSAGLKLIYEALQLFYVTENPNCPLKIKAAIFAALGYLFRRWTLSPTLRRLSVIRTTQVQSPLRCVGRKFTSTTPSVKRRATKSATSSARKLRRSSRDFCGGKFFNRCSAADLRRFF